MNRVQEDSGIGQSTVRYSPARPADGASPSAIVRGFVDAMLAYPAQSRTAAAFLTPEAARDWDRQAGVIVYGSAQVTAPPGGGSNPDDGTSVGLDLTETGRLDARGRFSDGRGTRSLDYRLEQVDGEWRISDPQAGTLVSDTYFGDYFRPFDVYFLDRPAERLVAEPVHLLVDDRLAAVLVTSLARGTSGDLLRTFVPSVDELRSTVPVRDGVADVGFARGSEDPDDLRLLSAQVVWTLRQVPGLDAVRIEVGSRSVQPSGVPDQPIDGYADLGPSDGASSVFALRDDRVVQASGDELEPIDGPWGRDAQGASAVALSDDRIVLLDGSRDEGVVADRDGESRLDVAGSSLLDPSVDPDGGFWLVDRPGDSTRVRLATDGVQSVPAPGLADLDVRSFDVSPDGARYVVTTGGGDAARVRVGAIERDERDAVTGLTRPRTLPTRVGAPRSAVWSDPVRVSFLALGERGVQVHTTLIDGSTTSSGATGGRALLPDVDAVQLVVGRQDEDPGSESATYAADREGRLWHLDVSGSWQLMDSAPVRSLTRFAG